MDVMGPSRQEAELHVDREVDERILLRNVSWSQYLALARSRGESDVPRLTFLDGVLELMSPSLRHSLIEVMIGRLLEAYADVRDLDLNGMGNLTIKRRRAGRALEPDGCYTLGPVKPVPDLAIEVVWTHGGIDKLDVYRPLGIGEVWTWKRGKIHVHVLRAGRYVEVARSRLLPELDLELLCRFVEAPNQTAAVRAFRAAVKAAPAPGRGSARRR